MTDQRKLLSEAREYLESTPQDSYYKNDLKRLLSRIDAALRRVTEERDKWKSEADGQFQYAGRLLDQLHVAESRNRRMVELLRECNKLFAEISLGQHSGIIQVNAMSLQVKSAELLKEVGE